MERSEEPARELRVVASRIDLEDISGRTLFPTMAQGPWMPFLRFAETVATGGGIDPESHSHRQEEVLNYVLEGRVEYEDDQGRRSVLGPGTIALFTARDEARHNLVPNQAPRARYLSLVVRCPPAGSEPAHRVQIAPAPRPPPTADGPIERRLVGPGAPVASEAGLQCVELEFTEAGRCACPVGTTRRALAYLVDGSASVDDRLLEAGSGALIENAVDVSFRGESGAHVLFASAPRA